jgi:uncharacterized membrane protein YuzA (DUF378 family)
VKNSTHVIAGIAVALTGVLCIPGVQSLLKSLVGQNPYGSLIVTCLLGLAALYHNPKAS